MIQPLSPIWIVRAAHLAEVELIHAKNGGAWPITFLQAGRIAAQHMFHVEHDPTLRVDAMFILDTIYYRRWSDDPRFLGLLVHETIENCILRGDLPVITPHAGANTAHMIAAEAERKYLEFMRFVQAAHEWAAELRARQEAERRAPKPELSYVFDEHCDSELVLKAGTARRRRRRVRQGLK